MPEYTPQHAEGHQYGLNESPGAVAPGEARVADNVEFSRDSISTMRGSKPVLLGDYDSVYKGGPPGSSLYVRGHAWNLEHEGAWEARDTNPLNPPNWVRNPWNARHGLIVVPQGGTPELNLNVLAGTSWAIETTLWTDDNSLTRQGSGNLDLPFVGAVVMAKGWSQGPRQWRLLILPHEPTGLGIVSDSPAFYIALELYDPLLATAHLFFYDTLGAAADPGSFFVPGKRHWVAFEFNNASPWTVSCHYWQEGMASAVVSTGQNLTAAAAFRLSGVEYTLATSTNVGCPLVIGGQTAYNAPGEPHGWNGVVGELRLYTAAATSVSVPTWDATYAYYDTEFADEDIAIGGAIESATDLDLYYSFRRESVSDTRSLLPRFTTGTAADGKAWLTGADATWRSGGGLDFMPSAPVAGQRDAFYHSLVDYNHATGGVFGILGSYNFAGGLRVPSGGSYLRRDSAATAATDAYLRPNSISFLVKFRMDDFDATLPVHTKRTLLQLCVARVGAVNTWDYTVEPIYEVYLHWDVGTSQWRIAGFVRDVVVAGSANAIGTTALAANTDYTALLTVAWGDDGGTAKVVARIYLDGVLETTAVDILATTAQTFVSEHTAVDNTAPNEDDEDGREECFPMAIGCDIAKMSVLPAVYASFTFGAPDAVGSAGGVGVGRRQWAFHVNDDAGASGKQPDDGIAYRGFRAHRGAILGAAIFHKVLTDQEAVAFSEDLPSRAEMTAYGEQLKSLWRMDEGAGTVVYDSGPLANHIPIHPYPQVRGFAGAIGRRAKSQILSFMESRTRTPREGVKGRDVFALTDGSICQLERDGSGDPYFRPISSRKISETQPLGSWFRFADFVYLCSGEGPVHRISRGRVSAAGLPAPWSPSQNDSLGWQEGDRDGTFQIVQVTTGAANFTNLDVYEYAVSFYDAEAGVESPPSRKMRWIVDTTGPVSVTSLQLQLLPKPYDRNVTHYRIYRSAIGGGVLYYRDQIPVAIIYTDDDPADTALGARLDTYYNHPPPKNARIGIQFGERAIYMGVPEYPSTIFPSKAGYPEHCPFEYQLTVQGGRSAELTGAIVLADRCVVFTQDTAYLAIENGGDISVFSSVQQPVTLVPIEDSIGTVNHQTIVHIDEAGGAVFACERGIAVTNTAEFQNITGNRLQTTWPSLDKSTYRLWHAVDWNHRKQYILFCSDGTEGARNNLAIVWDYRTNAFSVRRGIQARSSFVIEDKDTGQNRLYYSDYLGGLYELDSPDAPNDNYGVTRPGFSVTSGTIQAGGNSQLKLHLVGDGSLPMDADGLRGVKVSVAGETRVIVRNDTDYVWLEAALSAVPATGSDWAMGAIIWEHTYEAMDQGAPTRQKAYQWVQHELVPHSGSVYDLSLQTESGTLQTWEDIPADENYRKRGPYLGRGREMTVKVSKDLPDNPVEFKLTSLKWKPKGKGTW